MVDRQERKRLTALHMGVRELWFEYAPMEPDGWPEDEYDSYIWPTIRALEGLGTVEAIHATLKDACDQPVST